MNMRAYNTSTCGVNTGGREEEYEKRKGKNRIMIRIANQDDIV